VVILIEDIKKLFLPLIELYHMLFRGLVERRHEVVDGLDVGLQGWKILMGLMKTLEVAVLYLTHERGIVEAIPQATATTTA
jgi:hypothetical protein